MILFDKNKNAIHLEDSPFTSGGEAHIFKIKGVGFEKKIAKIFFGNITDGNFLSKLEKKRKKIEYIVKNIVPKISKSNFSKNIILPDLLLFDQQNNFIGYVMPFVENVLPLINVVLRDVGDSNLDVYLNVLSGKTNEFSNYNKLSLCINLTRIIKCIHDTNEIVIVDLKPENILINENGELFLIDLDSVQIKNKNVFFPAEVITPEYALPEINHIDYTSQSLEKNWDVFIVAMISYHILVGINPYSAIYKNLTTQSELLEKGIFAHGRYKKNIYLHPQSPHNNFFNLSKKMKNIFLEFFDKGVLDIQKRPSLLRLTNALTSEIRGYTVPIVNFSLSKNTISWDTKDAKNVKLKIYYLVNGKYVHKETLDVNFYGSMQIPMEESKYVLTVENGHYSIDKEIIYTLPKANITFKAIDENHIRWEIEDADEAYIKVFHISYKGGYVFKEKKQIKLKDEMIIPNLDSYYEIEAVKDMNITRRGFTISEA